ncbi:unnamed protein product, partial [Mesorhabditis belari]|uniref:AP-3 complex subunit delta n=1 Tax=Mesorhabditis belari TaxID=2138241 RepID=A0AAF3J7S3_9BILA
MALKNIRSNLDRLFDKSLTDLIRGIRNNKDNEARYIASCIEEIKMELKQDSTFIKANAIEKLAYLQMLGYDISWASFNIIEVMVSTKYTEKRIGYLAAAQSFHDSTEVLMLTTNLIRKDINSANMYDCGVALGGLACFVTPDLARDLASDIVNLLTSSRPYIRKRAVLLLYKIFLKYPDALRPTFPRLKEKLEDADPGVQSAAVNVICELARKNPKNYLTLAPVFFKLMTTSSNNWMLIKIIKLFGALVPLEPRLGKKLLEPLTNLINSTSAMSLLYECINTVIAVLISTSAGTPGDHTTSIQLCVQKLGLLIEDADQNLKYLGLLAMGKILQTHPKAVQAHKDIVLRCLDDRDESIRIRSLDLLYGMVSKKNIMEIVKKLMEHVEHAEGSHYRDELLSRIISICSYNNYQYITNFEWYISVLVELTKVEGTKHGAKIAEQIQDVTVRVESIRHFSVSQMALLVENANLLLSGSAQQRSNISEVLLAAAWICGEYSENVRDKPSVLEAMLKAKPSLMPGHILSVYVQNIGKLYAALISKAEEEEDWDAVDSLDNLMMSKLPELELAEHLEAQERACTLMAMLKVIEMYHSRKEKVAEEVARLYEGELNPVATKAQRKVPVPDGLDLDSWIGDEWEESASESSEDETEKTFGQMKVRSEFANFGGPPKYDSEEEPEKGYQKMKTKKKEHDEITSAELEKRRQQREREIQSNPYYVKGTAAAPKRPNEFPVAPKREENGESSQNLSIQSPLEIPGVVGLSRYMEQQDSTLTWKNAKKEKKKEKTKKGKGKKKRAAEESSSDEDEVAIVHQVNRNDGEMPENAKSTDDEDEKTNGLTDEFKALDVNLDEPLRPDEIVRGPQAYVRQSANARPFMQGPLQPRPPTTGPQKVITQEQTTKKKVAKKKKNDVETVESAEKKMKKKKKAKAQLSNGATSAATSGNVFDMDNWLDEENVVEEAADALKGEKKSKKKKKLGVPSREAYEEPSGVCTPSNPFQEGDTPGPSPIGSHSHLSSLASNGDLKADYSISVCPDDPSTCLVKISLSNEGTNEMKGIEINLCETLNARMAKDGDGDSSLKVSSISPNDSTILPLRVTVASTALSQKIRGSLTYFVQDGDNSNSEKLDFKLSIPATTFLLSATIGKESYGVLLSSDEIDLSASATCSSPVPFKQIVQRITQKARFTVVEEVPGAASLYATTNIDNRPVAVLVKKTGDSIQINGKSGDQQMISSIVDDLRELCSKK